MCVRALFLGSPNLLGYIVALMMLFLNVLIPLLI